ncbi:MAG: hypothetical protein NTV45_03740 [Firmicutes bacterium]|nr:hypothetical protein [Bacillota bacterium]
MTDNKDYLTESFGIMDNSMGKMWDMWMVSLSSLSSSQNQMENMAEKQLNQYTAVREELHKVWEDLSKQTRTNQEQVQKFAQETVLDNCQHMCYTSQSLIAELAKKVDDLHIYKGEEVVDFMMTPLKQWLKAQAGNSPAN